MNDEMKGALIGTVALLIGGLNLFCYLTGHGFLRPISLICAVAMFAGGFLIFGLLIKDRIS